LSFWSLKSSIRFFSMDSEQLGYYAKHLHLYFTDDCFLNLGQYRRHFPCFILNYNEIIFILFS